MKNNYFFKAIFDGFITSIGLLLLTRVSVFLYDFKYGSYVSEILAVAITIALAFMYFKLLQNIKSKRKLIVFSIISFFSFVDFYFIWCMVDLYIPFDILPTKEPDASDNVGGILLLMWFIFSYFISRLIALIKFLKQNPKLKR